MGIMCVCVCVCVCERNDECMMEVKRVKEMSDGNKECVCERDDENA